MDTLESLRRKSGGAQDLKSVVRTMKALAASNIGQYEQAVKSLDDYYRTVSLGIVAYFDEKKAVTIANKFELKQNDEKVVCAIVFGSDQGLVGQFNDSLSNFVLESLKEIKGKKVVWAIGERVQMRLLDAGFDTTKLFTVPNSVNAITSLVEQLLVNSEESLDRGHIHEFYIFHNQPKQGAGYAPAIQKLLPLDEKWRQSYEKQLWATNTIPQVLGSDKTTLLALIREYLFVSLFKACAESLNSENASRLDAMQRAEKNIEELLDNLTRKFHRLRQSSIDEELFDVVSGFEALKTDARK